MKSHIARCISFIKMELPVVAKVLNDSGRLTLREYLAGMHAGRIESYQDHSDLVNIAVQKTRDLIGDGAANRLQEDLLMQPAVLTANHHGLDTFAQSVQTNLIFSLRQRPDGSTAATIPVLACSNVPINNLTYPRGVLIYGALQKTNDFEPLRLPLFPDRYKRKMVGQIDGYSSSMLQRLKGRVDGLRNKQVLDSATANALDQAFREDFTDVLSRNLSSYSDQATLLNSKLWRRMYRDPNNKPHLIYLDMEKIVCELLMRDLNDQTSLIYQLLLDPTLRQTLVENLDGERSCWNREQLNNLFWQPALGGDKGAGTLFFWGIDEAGKRVPLTIVGLDSGNAKFCGTTDSGLKWEVACRRSELIEAIARGRLQPSLFTSYLVVSIARGVACIGGYYQASYLPVMQQGVVATLQQSSANNDLAELAANTATNLYLSGMQAVGLSTPNGIQAAGIFEIGGRGGLTEASLEKIANTVIYDAHVASITDTLADIDRSWLVGQDDAGDILASIREYVSDKIVMVSEKSGDTITYGEQNIRRKTV